MMKIIVTGNTVIPTLLTAAKDLELAVPLDPKRLVLVTSHRQEFW